MREQKKRCMYEMNKGDGSKGALVAQISSFSCSFLQKLVKIIDLGWHPFKARSHQASAAAAAAAVAAKTSKRYSIHTERQR